MSSNENLFQNRNKMIQLSTILVLWAKSRINLKQDRAWVMMMWKSKRFEELSCVSVHIPHLRIHTKIYKNKIMELFKYALTVVPPRYSHHGLPTSHQESIYSIPISWPYAGLWVWPNCQYFSSFHLCIRRLLMKNFRKVYRENLRQWPKQRRLLRPWNSNQFLKWIYCFWIF